MVFSRQNRVSRTAFGRTTILPTVSRSGFHLLDDGRPRRCRLPRSALDYCRAARHPIPSTASCRKLAALAGVCWLAPEGEDRYVVAGPLAADHRRHDGGTGSVRWFGHDRLAEPG